MEKLQSDSDVAKDPLANIMVEIKSEPLVEDVKGKYDLNGCMDTEGELCMLKPEAEKYLARIIKKEEAANTKYEPLEESLLHDPGNLAFEGKGFMKAYPLSNGTQELGDSNYIDHLASANGVDTESPSHTKDVDGKSPMMKIQSLGKTVINSIHRKKLVDNSYKNILQKHFSCEYCSYSTTNKLGIKLHLQSHTRKKTFVAMEDLGDQLETPPEEKSLRFGHSSYSVNFKVNSQNNLQPSSRRSPFSCDQCSFSARDKKGLSLHLLVHSDDRSFKCGQCSFSAKRKGSLCIHIRQRHCNERPFKCEKCSFTAIEKFHLYRHLVVHSDEKPFRCDQCSYAGKLKSCLDSHMLMHSNEKPLKCDQCSYAAKRKSSLDLHLRKHSGELPFKCNQCPYAARQKQSLKKHLLIH